MIHSDVVGAKQLGMYILAAGGAVATKVGEVDWMSYAIGASTLILIWSNIILNRKKIKHFDQTGKTSPEIVKKRATKKALKSAP